MAVNKSLPPIAFLAAFSLFLTIPWHWRNGSVATLAMIAWLFVLNLTAGINAVMWIDNIDIKHLVWCDIATKLLIGGSTALPAASLCVCTRLYRASAAQGKPNDSVPRRRLQIYESIVCYGIPVLFMALHYIVQGHRFDIVTTLGCRPTAYLSVPGLLIVWVPPVVLTSIALVLGVLALVNLCRHYRSFVENLRSADAGSFALPRYIRLMGMALTLIVWVSAATTFSLVANIKAGPFEKYTSWTDVHWGFSAVWTFPKASLSDQKWRELLANWYIVPVSTFIFVFFFAFGEDAVVEYRKAFSWIYQRCGFAWIASHWIPKGMKRRSSMDFSGDLPPLQFNRPKTTQNTFSVNINTITPVDDDVSGSEKNLNIGQSKGEIFEHREV